MNINMNNDKDLPKEIQNIYDKVLETKKFTHEKIDEYKREIFKLKVEYATNEEMYNILENIDDNLDHENRKLNNFKMTIVSALGTIFLPLGFITGYFGMNFRSMGNPSLKTGVLATKHVERFIFGLSIFSIIIISTLYYINF